MMGLEAAYVPAILALTSAGLGAYNSNQTAKKQDRAAADSIRNQRRLQDEANARVNKTLQDVKASSPEEERKSADAIYREQILKAQELARANMEERGLSSDYDQAAASANTQAQGYAEKLAGLMARMDGAVNQRVNEGFAFGNLTNDLGGIKRQSEGQQWIDQLKASQIRRNPWIDAASAALSAYAGGKAGGYNSSGITAGTKYASNNSGLMGNLGINTGYVMS